MKLKHLYLTAAAVLAAALVLAGCNGATPKVADTQRNAAYAQDAITSKLVANQPSPNITYSNERQNLIERYLRFSDPNKLSYITVVTPQGGVVYHGVVKGKVSNLSSQLTPADALDCQHFGANDPRPDGCGVVQIAEPDGSWSTNGGGIFWYDDHGVYHETSLPYFTSDQPFALTQPALLTIDASAHSDDVAPKTAPASPAPAAPKK